MAPKKMPSKKKPVSGKKTKTVSGGSKKITAISKQLTKTEIVREIATMTDLKPKDISRVLFEALPTLFAGSLNVKKGGCGIFVLPGTLKIQVIHKPATKARKGINPFTGEETTFKAKPARHVVKIKPLKKLKEMV